MSDLDIMEIDKIDLDPARTGPIDTATLDRIVEEIGRAPDAVIPLLQAI